MNRFVFWLNRPSLHVAPLIKSLAASRSNEVYVVTEWPLGDLQLRSGWSTIDHGDARVYVAPGKSERARLEEALAADSVNIFSGMGAYPRTGETLRRLSRRGIGRGRLVIYSESWDPDGLRGVARRFKHLYKSRKFGRHTDVFLPIGELAREQLLSAGAPRERVFPFGYCVSDVNVNLDEAPVPREPSQVRIAFVGRLISLKRPSMLLRACASLPTQQWWRLDVVGDGPLADSLAGTARSMRGGEVVMHGTVPNLETRRLLSNCDLLVLPSRYDGWGAAVNEALHAGTRCLVSDGVGASVLLRSDDRGAVFRREDFEDLKASLARMVAGGPQSDASRRELSRWAKATLGADAMSKYFLNVLQSDGKSKPPVGWL